jgi:hypothetical protein
VGGADQLVLAAQRLGGGAPGMAGQAQDRALVGAGAPLDLEVLAADADRRR